ncbi:LytR C-terminal domain-containing protein [Micromonospora zhanjiangensis]|uniref:LytR C-terminal domain-containing protein n=1 Tax=Micromonospora zhanjiangensis TaxID=1522057 RepID=A0ABV8KH87_9ACTN
MSFARVRALVVVGALTVLALVFIVVALVRDTQSSDKAPGACQNGEVRANIALPEPQNVKIAVYNATKTQGLADSVATNFGNRKFKVVKTAVDKKGIEGVAVLRYGPQAVGAAHLMRAYFLDNARTEYNPQRKDDVVDVVIGPKFQQLATSTEVNQSLTELGSPPLPPGACAANAKR